MATHADVKRSGRSLPMKHKGLDRQRLSAKQRTKRACDRCRQKKAKCDGQQPCGTCVEHERNCVFSAKRRREVRLCRLCEWQELLEECVQKLFKACKESQSFPGILPNPKMNSNNTESILQALGLVGPDFRVPSGRRTLSDHANPPLPELRSRDVTNGTCQNHLNCLPMKPHGPSDDCPPYSGLSGQSPLSMSSAMEENGSSFDDASGSISYWSTQQPTGHLEASSVKPGLQYRTDMEYSHALRQNGPPAPSSANMMEKTSFRPPGQNLNGDNSMGVDPAPDFSNWPFGYAPGQYNVFASTPAVLMDWSSLKALEDHAASRYKAENYDEHSRHGVVNRHGISSVYYPGPY